MAIPSHTQPSYKSLVLLLPLMADFPPPSLAAPYPRPPLPLAAHCLHRRFMTLLRSQTANHPSLPRPPHRIGNLSGHPRD